MKKELGIFKQKIKKTGIFDLNKVVKEIKGFLGNYKYNFAEKQNIAKEKDKGVEIIMEIAAEREIDDFYMYKMSVDIFAMKLNKVVVNDKKMDKGDLEIIFAVKLVLDHKNKFHGKIGNFLFKMYQEYLIKDKINKVHGAKLYMEGMHLFEVIKNNLDLD